MIKYIVISKIILWKNNDNKTELIIIHINKLYKKMNGQVKFKGTDFS